MCNTQYIKEFVTLKQFERKFFGSNEKNCQTQFQLASSVPVKLRTEITLTITVTPIQWGAHWALEHWYVTLQPKLGISEPNGAKIIPL